MSANLDTVLLWVDAVQRFEKEELPFIAREHEGDGIPDYVARSETWNNWVHCLCENQEISDWQYENWNHPSCCLTRQEIELARRTQLLARIKIE
jgi:hypothetical protein